MKTQLFAPFDGFAGLYVLEVGLSAFHGGKTIEGRREMSFPSAGTPCLAFHLRGLASVAEAVGRMP